MELIEEIKNIKSGKAELKKFGITLAVALAILGGLLFWRGKSHFFYFLAVSAVFLVLGVAVPILLKPIHKAWMTAAILLGWFMTRAILSALFFFVVTPIGILAKLFGKDFLSLRIVKDAESYWIPKKAAKFEKDNYERQF